MRHAQSCRSTRFRQRAQRASCSSLPSASGLFQFLNVSFQKQLLYQDLQQLRGGLVFTAHGLLYHSTLGLRVIRKKKRNHQHVLGKELKGRPSARWRAPRVWPVPISHKVCRKSFCISQLPHKLVNIFLILVVVKDKLAILWERWHFKTDQ